MLKKIFTLIAILAITGCTHTQLIPNRVDDSKLTLNQIETEMKQVEKVINDINSKRGLSGRNVGMALLFWPGIVVNEISASDALKMAQERLSVLSKLHESKNFASKY